MGIGTSESLPPMPHPVALDLLEVGKEGMVTTQGGAHCSLESYEFVLLLRWVCISTHAP